MSKKSGEMLAEIKHGIETGEGKYGIKVDGIAYTWKEVEPLYQYIRTIQNEYKTLQKRNSRQRLANRKQYELILKLQQENERLKRILDEMGVNPNQVLDYKSRCEKAIECIKKDIRWFDSEYARVYGELCDCAGAKGNRLEVMVNPSNALNILQNGGDKND